MVTPADTALSVVTVLHTVPYPPVFSSIAPRIGRAHHTKVLDAQSPNLMSPQQNSQQTAPQDYFVSCRSALINQPSSY